MCIRDRDRYGRTALTVACERGHNEVAHILIAHGATVDYQDKVRLSYVCIDRMVQQSSSHMYSVHAHYRL